MHYRNGVNHGYPTVDPLKLERVAFVDDRRTG